MSDKISVKKSKLHSKMSKSTVTKKPTVILNNITYKYIRKSELASILRNLMSREHLTQQELCNKIGVPQYNLSRWLSGKVYPREEQIKKLEKFFDVCITDINQNMPPDFIELSDFLNSHKVTVDGKLLDHQAKNLLLKIASNVNHYTIL